MINNHPPYNIRFSLSFKLFSAFFLVLIVGVTAIWLSRYIFAANFAHYIDEIELTHAKHLVPLLEEEYREHNGWEGIIKDWRHWMRLTRLAPTMDDAPLPPSGSTSIFLLDRNRRPIIGVVGPQDMDQLIGLEVDGTIVGWLGRKKHAPFLPGPPADLLTRENRQLLFLGGGVVALTALVALLLSHHLIKPIQQLTLGTKQLAQRNFAARIHATARDELGQLASRFNAMAETLEEYETMRRQWLTDISHELRTPLAVLRGEIEALLDGIREPTPANLGSLHSEILRLNKLIEDLHMLSLTYSDNMMLRKQRISPGNVIDEIVEGYRHLLEQRQIQLDVMTEPIQQAAIEGDAVRFGQVITNIMDNACKYVNCPGSLKIRGERDASSVTIYFHDSGPGVDERDLPRLFDRLYRADPSRSRETGGSGLGLSICRRIIDNHDGVIWAEASPLGGLAIGIRLPVLKKEGRPYDR